MNVFDNEEYLREILSEFKRTDEFYTKFRNEFAVEMKMILARFYGYGGLDSSLENDIKLYAEEIISTSESVTYKDKTYSEDRLQHEVDIMTRLVTRKPEESENPDFVNALHLKAKEMMVKYFPEIQELSGNGFRLLEKYARMYNWEFVVNYYSKETVK